MTPARWLKRPEGSTWGDFGPDDQRGRLNLITAEKVRQGAAEVREGLAFCLSLPLDYPGGNVLNPRRRPPRRFATLRQGRPNFLYRLEQEDPRHTDVVNDDAAYLYLQYSTQWDSLAHVGALFDADGDGVPEPVFYNGYRGGEHVLAPPPGAAGEGEPNLEGAEARALGVETLAAACIQGRAVLVDLERQFGRTRTLVGYDDWMGALEANGAAVEPGDVVCVYTGFADLVLDMRREPDAAVLHNACAALDGRDERLLQWITDSCLSALAADNYAVEALPAQPGAGDRYPAMPLHQHCLFKLGVPLGELWHLGEFARWMRAHGRTRFLLTAPALRLPGAVGSPVAPVATV